MPIQTILLDFSLEPARLGDESGRKTVFGQIESVIKEYIPNLILAADINIAGGSLKLLTGKRGATVAMRFCDRGFVTLNIEYYLEDHEEPLISFKSEKILENRIRQYITATNSQALPSIKRCVFGRYYPTSDERLLEYDVDDVLFEEATPFQKVQIVHSKTLGNMLVLDDLQNISEADLIYTETIMQRGRESYSGKEIVILGGGDGALLYELLKEKPKFVWMLEIDEVVMKACNMHMKSICGDVLERRKGPDYEVIIGDCMLTMEKFRSENRKVDYIFGDLTDIPISDADFTELWEFMINILQASFKILKTTGKFMTHGNGATSSQSLELYEQLLVKMDPAVTFNKTKAFIPSFFEEWIFYQIAFKNNDDK